MKPTTSRMIATAPAMEYKKSFGGVFLISVTALRATSRGCTLGFSGCARLSETAGSASNSGSPPAAVAAVCRFLSAAAVSVISEKLGPARRFFALLPPWTDQPGTQASRSLAPRRRPRRWRVPEKCFARTLSPGLGWLSALSPARRWKPRSRSPIPQPQRRLLPETG